MHNPQLEQSIYWLLSKVAIHARHDFARLAEQKFGLTWGQLYTLCSIDPSYPAPMNSIAGQLLCDASNVTGIVDRLVAQGFITRQDSTQDRRVKVLTLTRKGKKLRNRVLQTIATHQPASLQKLSKAEQHLLQELLVKVVANTDTSK